MNRYVTPESESIRGKIARYSKIRPEEVPALRREFTVVKLAAHIEEVVNSAPPLTPEQVERLRALLPPVDGSQ